MHRYVALIATSQSQDTFDQMALRLSRRFSDWREALNAHRAKAWVTSAPQAPIGFTSNGPGSCLIGVELGHEQVMNSRRQQKKDIFSNSWGAYVLIKGGEALDVIIARDPSGRIPCFVRRFPAADLYFSDIDDVPEAELGSPDPIDWDYIQYHLSVSAAHGSQTGLKAIAELLPGRQVRYSGGQGKESSAWPIAEIIASPFESPAAAQAGLRAAATEAVGGWARRYNRIALDLSGGFDSAVVLGLIREQAPEARVLGINYLIEHPEGDELVYAQAAADHNGVPLTVERLGSDGRLFDLDRARNWLRPNARALPLGYPEARAKAASTIDAQAAFSGTGGDHVFGQGPRPSLVAEAIRDRVPLPQVISIAHDYAKMSSDTLWNVAWANLLELWGPRRALSTLLRMPNHYLTREGREGVDFERFAHPDIFEVGDLVTSAKLSQIISFHELTEHYRRYDKIVKADEVNPLQSQLVLEASLRIPSYWINPAGRRRGLARRAFNDLIPDTILKRRGKSANGSHWLRVMATNTSFLQTLMLEGHLVRRGLLDKEKLETDLTPQRLTTKTHVPGLVQSIVTEMWVQSFAGRFQGYSQRTNLEPPF